MALGSSMVFASPWRRLAAATTDLFVLLLLHLALGAAALQYVVLERLDAVLCPVSTAICWLYLALCWGLMSGSPGKWLWGLTIRRLDGSRLSFADGLRRCAGYFVACLPVHLGFLPICWHPRRQGWHDALAGTVVVRRDAVWASAADLPPAPARPRATEPRTAGLWRGFGWVLAGYFGLAVLMTWPLAAQLGTRLPGPGGDTEHFVWGFWLLDHSLRHGLDPRTTDLLFWPQPVSMLNHTMAWLSGLASLPLQRMVGLVPAYNLVVLLNITSSAAALYLLAFALVKRRGAAFVGGLAFGFSPYFVTRFHEHANLLCAAPLPLVALCGWLTVTRGRARDVLGLALALTLAGLADWYYLVFAMVVLATLWIARQTVVEPPALTWSGQVLRLGVTAAICGLLLLPLLAPLLTAQHAGHGLDVPDPERFRYRAEPLDYLRPNPYHSLCRAPLDHTEWIAMPGWTMLGLAGLAAVRRGRRWRAWLLLALVALLLSLGPRLAIAGTDDFPRALLLVLGGPSGSAFEAPVDNRHLVHLAIDILGGTRKAVAVDGHVPLPLGWLMDAVPVLKPIKTPGRFGVLVLLVCGPLAAAGIVLVQDRLRWRGHRRSAAAVPWLAGALVLLEYCTIPALTHDAAIPAFYHHLAVAGDRGALVEVPISGGVHCYQYYQTLHHRPISAGHLSRLPEDIFRFADRNAVMHALRTAWLEPRRLPSNEALQAGLQELRRVGYRYVILHPELMQQRELKYDRWLLAKLGLECDRRWLPLYVYRLPPLSPARAAPGGATGRDPVAGNAPRRTVP